LDHFAKTTRFTTVVYEENEGNKGIGYTLNKGINMCSHELIIKMDSDDIMVPDRIHKQLHYMFANPHIQVCGGQVAFFKDNIQTIFGKTKHPSISWDEYKLIKSHWISNHPTLCYRKSAILEAGNYDATKSRMTEDFEITLRLFSSSDSNSNLNTPNCPFLEIHSNRVDLFYCLLSKAL
jgi:glycosyltransferase involved in cell wall biosynthesis